MSDPSVIPAVKRKLRDLLEAAGELDGVTIATTEADETAWEQIIIERGTSKPEFAGLGTRTPMREDPLRITCAAQVIQSGAPDYLDVQERAFDLVGVVTQLLRDNHRLDGTWDFGKVTSLEESSGVAEKGRASTVTFVIEGKARHH